MEQSAMTASLAISLTGLPLHSSAQVADFQLRTARNVRAYFLWRRLNAQNATQVKPCSSTGASELGQT